jgi:GH15 family glucan-1,4-alpha-glucosidase
MSGLRIEDYAMLGDGRSAALVGRDGSVDWLCWPRLDSGAVFARLLGTEDHGFWRLAPAGPVETTRAYEPGSMVLRTDHDAPTGRVRVTEAMSTGPVPALVRRVEGIAGEVETEVEIVLRPDYGRTIPWMERRPAARGHLWHAVAGPNLYALASTVDLGHEAMRTRARFKVAEGETVDFVLAHGDPQAPPTVPPAEVGLAHARATWADFSAQGRPIEGLPPDWQAAVDRSALVLKALTYAPTGGIAAAATTSLPEALGGGRNWDYRYCWLRDAAFTLDALLACGHVDEACAWRDWLVRAVAGAPEQLQIMYGLAGERILTEWEVPWLPGYEGSAPVRIGNAAAEQRQLDVYGEVADALAEARRAGLPPHPRSEALRPALLDHLATLWREPDEGIWEIRGPRRHYTHSKALAWVAFDRAAGQAADEDAAAAHRAMADTIRAEVLERAWDAEAGCFVQSYDASEVDAALLLLPLYGFIDACDARMVATRRVIEDRLGVGRLLLRYEGDDGLAGREGAFFFCSFWHVSVLAREGEVDAACDLFKHLLSLRNDVGLLAEQYDPTTGRQLGNLPQAFSHVGIINAAVDIARARAVG